jgi:hypothetical protein
MQIYSTFLALDRFDENEKNLALIFMLKTPSLPAIKRLKLEPGSAAGEGTADATTTQTSTSSHTAAMPSTATPQPPPYWIENVMRSLNEPEPPPLEGQFLCDLLHLSQQDLSADELKCKLQHLTTSRVHYVCSDEGVPALLRYQSMRQQILSLNISPAASSSQPFDFHRLPRDLFVDILSYIDAYTLSEAVRVDTYWCQVIRESKRLSKRPKPSAVEMNVYAGRYRFHVPPMRATQITKIHCVCELDEADPVLLVGQTYLCWIDPEVSETLVYRNLLSTESGIQYLRGHQAPLSQFVPVKGRATLVWTASEDGTLRLWDLSQDEDAACQVVLDGHDGHAIVNMDCDDQGTLVSVSSDGMLVAWKQHQPQYRLQLPDPMISLLDQACLAVDNETTVLGFPSGHLFVYQQGRYRYTLRDPLLAPQAQVDLHCFAQLVCNGSVLISAGSRHYDMCVWDINNGRLMYRLSVPLATRDPMAPRNDIHFVEFQQGLLVCTTQEETQPQQNDEEQKQPEPVTHALLWDFAASSARHTQQLMQQRIRFGPDPRQRCLIVFE